MVAISAPYSPYTTPTATSSTYRTAALSNPFDSLPAMTADSFTRISSMVSAGAGGGYAAYRYSEDMAESIFNYSQLGDLAHAPGVAFASFKEMGGIAFKGAGASALITAGISAVANGVGVARGTVDQTTAVRNVVADTITGAVGGLGAVTLGGLGGLGLVKLGVTGLPITIATVAIGAAAGVGASVLKDKLMKHFAA